jgi:uncharacterized protein YabN with tetrapyrrole methylase and pyrophosphatase domain
MGDASGGAGGSLIAVGTGIRALGQLTTEAIAWIRRAERVLYLTGDPIAEATLRQLNPEGAESLLPFYAEGRPRVQTYQAMTDRILDCVRAGMVTCVVTYGHPGVFADPIHNAIRRALAEGFSARILAAISSEDCLFADLGIDPARDGCQSYDATDFLLHQRTLDSTAGAVLWQVGVTGDPNFRTGTYNLSLLPLLIERLIRFHPPEHVVYVYEASRFPGVEHVLRSTRLDQLDQVPLSSASTLYIPPSCMPAVDQEILAHIEAMESSGRTPSTVLPIASDPL